MAAEGWHQTQRVCCLHRFVAAHPFLLPLALTAQRLVVAFARQICPVAAAAAAVVGVVAGAWASAAAVVAGAVGEQQLASAVQGAALSCLHLSCWLLASPAALHQVLTCCQGALLHLAFAAVAAAAF